MIANGPDPTGGFEFTATESGLWLPRGAPRHALGLVVAQPQPSGPTLVLPNKPTVPDGLVAYATESELGLRTMGRAEVIEWLSLLPSEATFLNIAILMRRLARIRTDPGAHLALARDIYRGAPILERMGRFCAVPGHVVFSEQALFALLCQAVIHCQPRAGDELSPDEVNAFKRLLLAAPGLLHDSPDIGECKEDEPETWLAYLTQNLLFNSTMNFGSGLARTWRMYGEMTRDPTRTWKSPAPIADLFNDVGLEPEQQLALAFGLYAMLGIDAEPVTLAGRGWRDMCTRVAPSRAPDEVISSMAATPAEMRAELTSEQARELDPELRWASVPFMERPFLRLQDDRLLLVSRRAIEAWPTHGTHFRLLKAARNRGRAAGIQTFTGLAGEVTEAYAVELVEKSHAAASRRYFDVGQVLRAQPLGDGETTDVFVAGRGDIVIMEISSRRVTAATRLTGDTEALQDDLRELVVKRIEQLDRTVEALRGGILTRLPDPADIRRIFPVIVNVEPLRWSGPLHEYLTLNLPGRLRQPGVQPLQFVELEDLEWLMSAIGRMTLAELLSQKIEEFGVDPDIQQWLHSSPLAPPAKRPLVVTAHLDRMFDAAAPRLGLTEDELQRWRHDRLTAD